MVAQLEFFEIASPCQRICETDKQGYCLNCFRSREERFDWLTFSNSRKREVLRLCRQRALRKRYELVQKTKQNQLQLPLSAQQLDLL